ncbi:DUF1080 domain-containing protein [Isosphaeraceae bacterium EP7]
MISTTIAAALMLVAQAQEPAGADEGWKPLFNGRDLTGWYTFLQVHGKDKDPDHVITIEDGMIRLYKNAEHGSKVVMGYIGTNDEYGDYHFRFKYRWGKKQFEPRLKLKRDAGLYYHILGKDAVWPRSLQFQVQQTDVGDLIALDQFQVDTWTDPKTLTAEIPTFMPADRGGEVRVMGGKGIAYQGRLPGPIEVEGWNTAEIIVSGDSTTHILNGTVVNRAVKVRLVEDPSKPGESRPITRGRIALEIEAAEVDFRDVEIRSLPAATSAKP